MKITKATISRLNVPDGKAERFEFCDDLPGFGVRLRAGGSRVFVAQFRVNGRQRRMTLGSLAVVDLDAARQRAREVLAMAALGRDPSAEQAEAKAEAAVTVRSVLPAYFDHARARQRPASFADTKRYLTKAWAPFAGLPVAAVDRPRIAACLLDLARASPVAANRARAALSGFFSWTVAQGLTTLNPVSGTMVPTPEVARDRVLSDDELRLVWRLAGPGDYGAIVQLLVLLATRRDEVAAMAWTELEGSAWTIPAARAKNGRPLLLDLPPAALAILDSVERRDGRALVFGSRAGPFSGWSRAKADLDARMLAALRAERGAKATLEPWRLHDLRRTAATGMADLGVGPHVVEAVLNHVSGSKAGVAGIYNRATYRPEKRAALALWADRIAEIVA